MVCTGSEGLGKVSVCMYIPLNIIISHTFKNSIIISVNVRAKCWQLSLQYIIIYKIYG